MKWKKPKTKTVNAVVGSGNRRAWKFKKNKHDSAEGIIVYTDKKARKKIVLYRLIIVIVVLVVGYGAYWLFQGRKNNTIQNVQPEPTLPVDAKLNPIQFVNENE